MGLYQAITNAEMMNLGKVVSEIDSELLVKAIVSQKFSRLLARTCSQMLVR